MLKTHKGKWLPYSYFYENQYRGTDANMKKITWIVFGLILHFAMVGQGGKKMTREAYIRTFSDLSMKEMARVGIPASITLAQGCLESNNGNSTLAVKANNHFGIKCHEWTGKTIRHDDDSRKECFSA